MDNSLTNVRSILCYSQQIYIYVHTHAIYGCLSDVSKRDAQQCREPLSFSINDRQQRRHAGELEKTRPCTIAIN